MGLGDVSELTISSAIVDPRYANGQMDVRQSKSRWPSDRGTRVKLKRGSKVEGDLCQVCHEEASGVYFGALVCLPCKSFFIRCNKAGAEKFKCIGVGQCDVLRQNRLRCQYCRYQRCLQAGMYRREKPEVIEPSDGEDLCRICGDFANGTHFGVVTCEGCKKFFRRGMKEADTYECVKTKNCKINPRNRNVCRYCRFQKCIDVGMSREAIRMGRPKRQQPTFKMDGIKSSIEMGSADPMSGMSSCMYNTHSSGMKAEAWNNVKPIPPISEVMKTPQSPRTDTGSSRSKDEVDPLPPFDPDELEEFLDNLETRNDSNEDGQKERKWSIPIISISGHDFGSTTSLQSIKMDEQIGSLPSMTMDFSKGSYVWENGRWQQRSNSLETVSPLTPLPAISPASLDSAYHTQDEHSFVSDSPPEKQLHPGTDSMSSMEYSPPQWSNSSGSPLAREETSFVFDFNENCLDNGENLAVQDGKGHYGAQDSGIGNRKYQNLRDGFPNQLTASFGSLSSVNSSLGSRQASCISDCVGSAFPNSMGMAYQQQQYYSANVLVKKKKLSPREEQKKKKLRNVNKYLTYFEKDYWKSVLPITTKDKDTNEKNKEQKECLIAAYEQHMNSVIKIFCEIPSKKSSDHFLDVTRNTMVECIKFALQIPGFGQIHETDQAILLQYGCWHLFILVISFMQHDKKAMGVQVKAFLGAVASKYGPLENWRLQLTKQLKNLSLSCAEKAAICALAVLSTASNITEDKASIRLLKEHISHIFTGDSFNQDEPQLKKKMETMADVLEDMKELTALLCSSLMEIINSSTNARDTDDLTVKVKNLQIKA